MKNLFQKVFVFLLLLSISSFAQLTLVSGTNLVTETDIYVNNQNVRYSDLIKIKFNQKIIDLPIGESIANLNDISNPDIKNHFLSLKSRYGDFSLNKAVPWTFWGDTIKTHKRTGEQVIVKDWSQIFHLNFNDLVPIDSIINELKSINNIEWVDGPMQAYLLLEPNDYYFQNGEQWSLQRIQAAAAWNITTGSTAINIFIHDFFFLPFPGHTQLHPELINKVDYHYNGDLLRGHGIAVAGVAGAETDNAIGVASLGWNIRLGLHGMTYNTIRDAVDNRGADVLNFSYLTANQSGLRDAIEYAISLGVICVAAAGNSEYPVPFIPYPAAYNFGPIGQVIAVSGTKLENDVELFVDGWNYSPGNDPINDPTNSFIDVAAPGKNIKILRYNWVDGYWNVNGTSASAPMVSALAGLLLSIDNTLTPPEIYDIITKSAEKIGQYSYDANGWNRYMGYGRVNAFYAVAPPDAPQNLTSYLDPNPSCNNCHEWGGGIQLDWEDNNEPDLSHYIIYRSEEPGRPCSDCHTSSGGAPGDSLGEPDPINDPVNVSEECPSLAGEHAINGTKTIVETGCESGLEETERLEFEPIWAWWASYWVDMAVTSDYTYFYYVTAVDRVVEQESDISNITSTYVPVSMAKPTFPFDGEVVPKIFYLYPNFPNPFNPTTIIRYQVPNDVFVSIEIFDVLGKKIKTLVNENKTAGYYSAFWDGTNDFGQTVANGLFIYKMSAGSFTNIKKMLLIK